MMREVGYCSGIENYSRHPVVLGTDLSLLFGELHVNKDYRSECHKEQGKKSKDIGGPSVRVFPHDLLVVGNVNNDCYQHRCGQSIQNRRINQRFDW
jgi:hypothetical protein